MLLLPSDLITVYTRIPCVYYVIVLYSTGIYYYRVGEQ